MEENIWTKTILYIRTESFPIFPGWAYIWLMILGAWRIVTILSCVCILLIPICKGKQSRRKYLWLVQAKYASLYGSTPYLVPNKSMTIVICELLSGAMYLVMACLYYTSFRSLRFANSLIVTTAWSGMCLLPTYVGIWLSGWGWLYTCISSGLSSKKKSRMRFLKPAIFNSLWISWTVLVSSVTILFSLLFILRLKTEYDAVNSVLGQLERLASEDPANSNHSQNHLINPQTIASLWDGLHKISYIVKLWSISWVVFNAILASFYASILWRLFRKIRKLFNICKLQGSLLSHRFEKLASPISRMPLIADRASLALTKLREELRFLALYNALILISLLCEVGVSCFQLLHSEHLNDADWLALAAILCMMPSSILSPTVLVQCWRIFTERGTAEDSDFDDPSKLVSQLAQLPIFYDKLLKWYDDPNLDETEMFHFDATFADLVATPQEPTTASKSDISVETNDRNEREQFTITKTVVIVEM